MNGFSMYFSLTLVDILVEGAGNLARYGYFMSIYGVRLLFKAFKITEALWSLLYWALFDRKLCGGVDMIREQP